VIPRYCLLRRPAVSRYKRYQTPVSRANRRYYRTIVLGVMAMAALVWVAMDQFGISRQELTGLFLGVVLVVVLVILCAGVIALLWVTLRKWARRDQN
jgi:hypothetical protein